MTLSYLEMYSMHFWTQVSPSSSVWMFLMLGFVGYSCHFFEIACWTLTFPNISESRVFQNISNRSSSWVIDHFVTFFDFFINPNVISYSFRKLCGYSFLFWKCSAAIRCFGNVTIRFVLEVPPRFDKNVSICKCEKVNFISTFLNIILHIISIPFHT